MKIRYEFKWLWKAFSGHRWAVVWSGIAGIFRVGTMLFFILLCKKTIDIATSNQEGNLMAYAAVLVGTMLANIAAGAIYARLTQKTEIRVNITLRQRLFDHLMRSYWTNRDNLHTGDVINRLGIDVKTVGELTARTAPAIIVTTVQLCAAFYFLYRLDPLLAGIIVLIMPVLILASRPFIAKTKKLSLNIRESDSRIQALLQDNLRHRTLVQTLEQNESVAGKFRMLQNELLDRTVRRIRFSISSRTLVSAGFAAGYLTAFLWGAGQLHQGHITFGVMIALMQLAAQIQRPTIEASRNVPLVVQALASADRLIELENIPEEEQGEPVILPGIAGVNMKNVTFSYPGRDKVVLNDFSFDFAPGSRNAILGPSGVGKSTLIRLILALLTPQEGTIEIYDGKNREIVSPRTRGNIVYVPQGNTILYGTIRENLLMGNPKASPEQLEQALYTAAADFVYSLPGGLDSLCGEGGVELSEGEAQRIAIARGVLRPGTIMLLDEITSALDKTTRESLMERLTRELSSKTMIFITHQESIAAYCPRIINLNQG